MRQVISEKIRSKYDITDEDLELLLKQINSEINALEKTPSSLEDDIKIAMGEADTLVSPTGDVMALWKNTKPTMK